MIIDYKRLDITRLRVWIAYNCLQHKTLFWIQYSVTLTFEILWITPREQFCFFFIQVVQQKFYQSMFFRVKVKHWIWLVHKPLNLFCEKTLFFGASLDWKEQSFWTLYFASLKESLKGHYYGEFVSFFVFRIFVIAVLKFVWVSYLHLYATEHEEDIKFFDSTCTVNRIFYW